MELSRSLATAAIAAIILSAWPAMAEAPPPPIQPSSEHLRLAHDAVQASGVETTLIAGFRALLKEQVSQIDPTQSDDQRKLQVELRGFAENWLEADVPELVKGIDEIYASEFTDSELQDIEKFYRSETGRILAEKYPQLVADASHKILKGGETGPITAGDVAEIRLELRRSLVKQIPREFNSAQIDEIVAFMISPAGQEIMLKQQVFTQKTLLLVQTMLRQLNHASMEKWCDLAHCTPRMRSWIDHPELMNVPERPPG